MALPHAGTPLPPLLHTGAPVLETAVFNTDTCAQCRRHGERWERRPKGRKTTTVRGQGTGRTRGRP